MLATNGIATWLDGLGGNLRHGVRVFGRHPLLTALSIVTLSLGIGANAAIFSVFEAVLLRPLPYPAAERLVVLMDGRQRRPRGDGPDHSRAARRARGEPQLRRAVLTSTRVTSRSSAATSPGASSARASRRRSCRCSALAPALGRHLRRGRTVRGAQHRRARAAASGGGISAPIRP